MASVLIVMGSGSDLPKVEPAAKTLDNFGIAYRMAVCSAHRDPERLRELVREFEQEGGQVIIAAAGMAAHLPGVVASLTILPVIGLPISATLMGLDALLAIVQMPPGIPVATVGIDQARNAALLACQILARTDSALREQLAHYKEELREKNRAQHREIAEP